MQVKIYTKDLIPLTTLVSADVESLEYTDKLAGDGSAGFMIRADTTKVTKTNIQMYNRVKFYEGTKCVFYGFINQVDYNVNTVKISLFSIGYLLKNRTLGASFLASGTISTILPQILTTLNSADNTGISQGTVVDTGTVYNKTYDSGNNVDYILRDLLGADIQFRVDMDGKVQIAPVLGTDLSGTVKLKYNTNQVENSNITQFQVKESGQSVLSEILAKRTGSNVTVTSPTLKAKYGLIQTTKTYSYIADDVNLALTATKDLSDTLFTPELTLSPNFTANFEVCDILGIAIYNKFVDIKATYQVLEKAVTYLGVEKTTKIKLNDSQKNLIEILLDQKERIKLLENK